jgi:hypothetical protein
MLAALACPQPAHADGTSSSQILHDFAQYFLGIGGYWFTDGVATRALGTPKFSGTTHIFVRPAIRGQMQITGGVELFGATDHWFPFSGGNSVSLTGLAFRVSSVPHMNRVIPFVDAGYYYADLHSDLMHFHSYGLVPSIAFGVEYRFARYLSLTANYRVTGNIRGISTDGFNLGLRFF